MKYPAPNTYPSAGASQQPIYSYPVKPKGASGYTQSYNNYAYQPVPSRQPINIQYDYRTT